MAEPEVDESDLQAELQNALADASDLQADDAAAAAAQKAALDAQSASTRLDFLLKQTDLFSHFVKGNSALATAAAKHRRSHNEQQEDEELVAAADSATETRIDVQPSIVKGNMREYQMEALNWLIKLHDAGVNGILADEMGLGKTLESISLLGYLYQFRNIKGPHLIIAPKSTVSNWVREVARWCPTLKTLRFHGSKDERPSLVEQLLSLDWNVCITTYEMVIIERASLKKVQWQYLYIDEAHRIKNEQSLLSKVVRLFSTSHRLLITGTPLQNNLHELWALLNFLLPDVFNSADDFERWFDISDQSERDAIVKRLHKVLRPFLLRRLKVDVESSLPPKKEIKLFVGMTALQQQWYKNILGKDIDLLNSSTGSRVRLLNLVMQLRKVCNHPYLFDGAEPGPPYEEGEHMVQSCGKMMLLDKLLTRMKQRGSRVLIFSQMTRMLDILEDYCRFRGHEYCRIDGSTNQDGRDEGMDSFNAPNSSKFVFLLSTRAGGLGINLQTADIVVLYDSDWNPQADLQAMDRAHRIGQKKPVFVYRFCTDKSVEQKMIERADKKLFLNALVIQQGRLAEQNQAASADELMAMVKFGAEEAFHSKEASFTDDDIDFILSQGEQRTEQMNAQMTSAGTQHSLANFSLAEDNTNKSIYDFHGVRKNSAGQPLFFIEPPKRERKSTVYDADAYYRNAMNQSSSAVAREKVFKPAPRFDFQFFDIERLNALEEKEWNARQTLRAMKEAEKERIATERRMQKLESKEVRRLEKLETMRQARLVKIAALREAGQTQEEAEQSTSADAAEAEQVAGSDSESEEDEEEDEEEEEENTEAEAAAVTAPSEMVVDSQVDSTEAVVSKLTKAGKPTKQVKKAEAPKSEDELAAEAEKLAQMEREAGVLTDKERRERDRLAAAGFGTWTRKDFTAYTKALETFGRKNKAAVFEAVEGKTAEEVAEYDSAFWKHGPGAIKDWARLIGNFEKSEARMARLESIVTVLRWKVGQHTNPLFDMKLTMPKSSSKFSEEEDRFLVCAVHECGYGQWDQIKMLIRSAYHFRFNWFIKSRTPIELQRRADTILKVLEKEMEEWQAEQKKKKTVAKPKPTPTKNTPGKKKAEEEDEAPKGKGKAASSTKKRKSPEAESTKKGKGSAKKGKEVSESESESDDESQEEPSKKRKVAPKASATKSKK